MLISIAPAVESALKEGGPVVALESTVIAHGLPAPHNLETARACEDVVLKSGATPATIGVIAGHAVIGLDHDQLEQIAARDEVLKINLANLGYATARQRWGATTVASTLHLAQLAGIKVFSTGGIGGAHRGAGESFDISADLTALARYPMVVVCAGAKAILDLPKTLEILETLGVPVAGYGTDELPAFYSRSSGLRLDLSVETPQEAAALALAHWEAGFSTAVLIAAPVPREDEVPAVEISQTIEEALSAAAESGVTGKAVTPFLLSRIAERTAGRTLRANIALLRNNARIAGRIAAALSEMTKL